VPDWVIRCVGGHQHAEPSALNLTAVVMMRISEDRALRRYLNTEPLLSQNQ
jgi:hypothetical protein